MKFVLQPNAVFLFISEPPLQDLTGLVRILRNREGTFPWSLATGAFSNVFKGELTTPGRTDAGSVRFLSSKQ